MDLADTMVNVSNVLMELSIKFVSVPLDLHMMPKPTDVFKLTIVPSDLDGMDLPVFVQTAIKSTSMVNAKAAHLMLDPMMLSIVVLAPMDLSMMAIQIDATIVVEPMNNFPMEFAFAFEEIINITEFAEHAHLVHLLMQLRILAFVIETTKHLILLRIDVQLQNVLKIKFGKITDASVLTVLLYSITFADNAH